MAGRLLGIELKKVKFRFVKASFTIETAVVMSVILIGLHMLLLAIFYYHDKNIIAGAAYETAVVASTKLREKYKGNKLTGSGIEEVKDESEQLLFERISGKCLLFGSFERDVEISDKEVIITVSASRGRLRTDTVKKAAVTTPEKNIRDKRRLKDLLWNED